MDSNIIKYKKRYKFFLILMLIGFIDSIVIPVVVKEANGSQLFESGLIPVALYYVIGSAGLTIGILFNYSWFIWGLVAAITKRKLNKLEKESVSI